MCFTELLCNCACYSVSFNDITGSGEAFGEALKANTSLKKLDLSYCNLGPEDGKGLASGVGVHASLTECIVHGNKFDKESATLLSKAATEKRVMLFGIKHDQTEANFNRQYLKPADGILIASDLRVSAVLTELE